MKYSKQPEVTFRFLKHQTAIADFGTYALREPLLSNILKEAARVCADALDVPFSAVCRYRHVENDLLIEAGHGWKESVIGRISEVSESNPQGRAYISGGPMVIADVRDAENLVPNPLYDRHGIVSIANVIIKGQDGFPYGVLEIDSPTRHVYSEHDIAFLTKFADVLALLIANSRKSWLFQSTHNEMQSIISERDGLLAKNAALVDQNKALLVEKYKLLGEHNALVDEFTSKINNNLQVIYGMLNCHLFIETDKLRRSSLKRVIRRVMTLANIYGQWFRSGTRQAIAIDSYLTSLCGILPGLQSDNNPNIKLTCSSEALSVTIDTVTAVGMVVAELVSNSYEHAFNAGAGTIKVALHQSGPEMAVLTVSDDGSGFTERGGSKRHGVGLVRRLIEQVNGSIEHYSTGGTTWMVRFPTVAPSRDNRTLH